MKSISEQSGLSINFLSAKFGFTPPPRKGGKTFKLVENPQKIDTFSAGGGGTQFYGQSDFMDIWAFLNIRKKTIEIVEHDWKTRTVVPLRACRGSLSSEILWTPTEPCRVPQESRRETRRGLQEPL